MSKAKEKERKGVEKEIEKLVKKANRAKDREDYEKTVALYQEIARLAGSIKDKRAVDFCLDAAKHSLKTGEDFKTGWSYKCAAVYSLAFKDFNNTINFGLKAIEYFSKSNSMYAVQWCYNLIGEASEKIEDYDLAIKSYRKSLEIEYSEEIDKKLKNLLKIIPHPTINQECEEEFTKEGKQTGIKIRVSNETKEILNNIKIVDEDSNEIETIPSLKPGETKTFRYRLVAEEGMKSPLSKVIWIDADGEKKEKKIGSLCIHVKPNIEIKPYLKNTLEIGKHSYFVISVMNHSKHPIEDVNLEIKFPVELKVQPVTGYSMKRVEPMEEKGFVFKVLPTVVGKTIVKPVVNFRDINGKFYRETPEPFMIEESLEAPPTLPIKTGPMMPVKKENIDQLKRTEEFKRYVESFMHPKEMSEPEYVKLTKKFRPVSTGYTLKGVDIETISNHVMEECKGMKLVGEHAFGDERLYMFAGGSTKTERTYLLTVVVKKENDFMHVAFRLYSDKEEGLDDFLGKVVNIIKYTIIAMSFATEIQKIEVKETINIIDSIVQRSRIGGKLRKKDKNIDIKDSVVQRTEL